MIGMVWAQTPGGVIAADGELPWDVPEDLQHFRDIVSGRPVIVGRPTWESMPPAWRRKRAARSVVLTRSADWRPEADEDAERASSMADALALLAEEEATGDVWIMGGGEVYVLGAEVADLLVISEIDVPEPDGELTLGPDVTTGWVEEGSESGWRWSSTGTRWRVRRLRRR